MILFFLAGCAPSITQHRNIWKTINKKTSLVGYSKKYLVQEFSFPSEKTVKKQDDKRVETWIYQTNLGDKYGFPNFNPVKTKHMKLTIENDVVTESSYE